MPKQIYFWLALIWTFVIAFLCLASFGNMPKVSLQSADKYAHFTFYFVFTWLWFLYLSHKKNGSGNLKTMLLVFSMSLFYGVGIEIMQGLFTIARKADFFDVVANTAGAGSAFVSIWICEKYIAKRKSI